jgi:hypothetical protein
MTELRGGSGFSMAPQPLGGSGSTGGGRGRKLAAAIVVIFAAAVVAFGASGERLAQQPNLDLSFLATPQPSASPSLRPTARIFDATPTELPAVTRPGGDAPGGVLVGIADGIQIVDLAAGTLGAGAQVFPGRDALVRRPGDEGWTCVCAVEAVDDGRTTLRYRVVRIAPNGMDIEVTTDDPSVGIAPSGGVETRGEVNLGDDGTHGLVAMASGFEFDWRISIATVDLETGRIGAARELPAENAERPGSSGAPPSIQPDYGVSYDAPHVRLSPDGRTAFVWELVEYNSEAASFRRFRAWRVGLAADGTIEDIQPSRILDDLPLYCSSLAFLTDDQLVWMCPDYSGSSGLLSIRTIRLDGSTVGQASLTLGDGWGTEPMFDRANRLAYHWDPGGLNLSRIDLVTMRVVEVRYDPAVERADGVEAVAGSRPPLWTSLASASAWNPSRLAIPSADSAMLYLAGLDMSRSGDRGPASHGVFVVDRATMALVDRWAPVTAYMALSLTPDGRYVAAGGQPGITAAAQPARWASSLTFHDVTDGRVALQLGRLGESWPVTLLGP